MKLKYKIKFSEVILSCAYKAEDLFKRSSGTEPSVYTHYLYDAGGNRVKKYTRTAGGNWETITYIDGLIEYRENDKSDYQSINHVMDDTRRIATIREGKDFGDSTPAIKYNLDDHLGSSNTVVDENGTLVNQEEYYPFGETSFGSYAKKRYRFCGKEKDEESGMYYYGARYYSPWLCRFISVDPLAGKYAQLTPYNYAGNEPIADKDIDGMQSVNTDTSQVSQPQNLGQPDSKKSETTSTANLIIIIASKEDIAEKKLDKSAKTNGQWETVTAESMSQAMEQIAKRYPNIKFDNVIIHSHGVIGANGGGQMKLSENKDNPVYISAELLNAYMLNPTNDTSKTHIKKEEFEKYNKELSALNTLFKSISEKGNVVIAACYAGKGDKGMELGKSLVKFSANRVNVYLNQDYSSYLTFNKDTKGSYGSNTKQGFMHSDRLTSTGNLKLGWIKFASDGEMIILKNKQKDGNLYIGAYKGNTPLSTKPIYLNKK